MGYREAVGRGGGSGTGVLEWNGRSNDSPVRVPEWPEPAAPSFGAGGVVREAQPSYRNGDGDRFCLRGEEPFSDEEVEALEALAEKIGERAAHLHAGEQEMLEWIAEFDRREGWKLHGHRSCVEWLAFWTGMDRRTARERVRVARALEELPETKEAMGRGRLSFSKVRAITRLGELEGEDEASIVEVAEKTTAVEVEKVVRTRRTLSRLEEEERERQRHASRKLAVVPDDQGMYVIHGRLDPEVGAVLMRAIEAAGDALYKVEKEEPLGPEPPEPEQRRADALGLLAERALAAGFGAVRKETGPDLMKATAERAWEGRGGDGPLGQGLLTLSGQAVRAWARPNPGDPPCTTEAWMLTKAISLLWWWTRMASGCIGRPGSRPATARP